MTTAPICLFVYKRLDTLKLTVEALQNNHLSKDSVLYIFSDSARTLKDQKGVTAVREYLRCITGFKEVIIHESTHNNGLANSIIEGVSMILDDHDKIIVLEDDLVTTRNFLMFMNQALDYYAQIKEIKSVNGFSLKIKKCTEGDVFFHNRPYSWGWGTWKNSWNKGSFSKERVKKSLTEVKLDQFSKSCGADASKMLLDSLEGVNDSWYARWIYSHFVEKKMAVYPFESKVQNIGFGKEGTHCKTIDIFTSFTDKSLKTDFDFEKRIIVNKKEDKQFLKYFTTKHKILFRLSLLKSFSGLRLIKEDLILKFFSSTRFSTLFTGNNAKF